MTRDELVTAIADDQEITRTKAEDMLQLLADLCAETLTKGEPFHLGIGFIAVRPPLPALRGNLRGMMIFQSTEKFRTRLGLTGARSIKLGSGICKRCRLAPVKVHVYDECEECRHSK